MDTLNTTLTRITNAFWEELGKIKKLTGISREVIALTLYRLNEERDKKWEAELWKHTRSKDKMRRWIQDLQKEARYDEHAFLELARLLPAWARRSLLEIAKALPSPHGGKPRALHFRKRLQVTRRFQELTQHTDLRRRLSKNKAYEKIAKEQEVSPHTVRIICDPRERERSRKAKRGIALMHFPTQ